MTTYEANFTNSEYQRRVDRTRKTMAARNMDAIVVSDPSNMS
ncbi:MAG TPA: ectoine hydrolase DoeA, partial [Sulfitobacter sp.]|nr:ectoine hydrolase DoeA [Sulfitobacter sp.]